MTGTKKRPNAMHRPVKSARPRNVPTVDVRVLRTKWLAGGWIRDRIVLPMLVDIVASDLPEVNTIWMYIPTRPDWAIVSEANRRDHWTKSAARKKQQRLVVGLTVLRYAPDEMMRLGREDIGRLSLEVTRVGPGHLDIDNLWGAFKATWDGIADALGVDDRHFEKARRCDVKQTTIRGKRGVMIRLGLAVE